MESCVRLEMLQFAPQEYLKELQLQHQQQQVQMQQQQRTDAGGNNGRLPFTSTWSNTKLPGSQTKPFRLVDPKILPKRTKKRFNQYAAALDFPKTVYQADKWFLKLFLDWNVEESLNRKLKERKALTREELRQRYSNELQKLASGESLYTSLLGSFSKAALASLKGNIPKVKERKGKQPKESTRSKQPKQSKQSKKIKSSAEEVGAGSNNDWENFIPSFARDLENSPEEPKLRKKVKVRGRGGEQMPAPPSLAPQRTRLTREELRQRQEDDPLGWDMELDLAGGYDLVDEEPVSTTNNDGNHDNAEQNIYLPWEDGNYPQWEELEIPSPVGLEDVSHNFVAPSFDEDLDQLVDGIEEWAESMRQKKGSRSVKNWP